MSSGESTNVLANEVKRGQQYRAVGPQDQTCNTEVMSSSLALTAQTTCSR